MSNARFLETAIEAARAAGQVALDRFNQPQVVTSKGFRDIVTEADVAAQDAAVAAIHARFPGAAILAEENLEPDGQPDLLWVIDPIDGTTNYARHVPTFCASVGVVEQGRPIAGAVFDPLRAYLFTAERGRGAHLNGAPIHVSEVDALSDAVLTLDWSAAPELRARSLSLFHRIATDCRTVRAIGSAVLAMCFLAAGWVDLYFNLGLKRWDGAAAQVIIEEAGGRITNSLGETWDYTQPDAFASNGRLHSVFDLYQITN